MRESGSTMVMGPTQNITPSTNKISMWDKVKRLNGNYKKCLTLAEGNAKACQQMQ
eukprot:Awhi_evm1s2903